MAFLLFDEGPEVFEFLGRERADIASRSCNQRFKTSVSAFEFIDAGVKSRIAFNVSFTIKVDEREKEVADFFDEIFSIIIIECAFDFVNLLAEFWEDVAWIGPVEANLSSFMRDIESALSGGAMGHGQDSRGKGLCERGEVVRGSVRGEGSYKNDRRLRVAPIILRV